MNATKLSCSRRLNLLSSPPVVVYRLFQIPKYFYTLEVGNLIEA